MSTIPSTTARNFWAVQTTFLISGATYAAVGNVRIRWGYKIHEVIVTGQSNPYLGTGAFHGEIELEGIGSSDNRWENAVTITSGIVTGMNVQWTEKDTQTTMSGRTWTASGVKFFDRETHWQNDKEVLYRLKGTMALEPAVS